MFKIYVSILFLIKYLLTNTNYDLELRKLDLRKCVDHIHFYTCFVA